VSALTQFFIATLVLAVAAGGALINFKLIALPMSEMVGAGDYLTASLRTSEVAALVIIFVEATMGLFLMETLRITHLFPRIHSLSEVMRKRMMWASFVLLFVLAGVEAALGADARHADRRQAGAAAVARRDAGAGGGRLADAASRRRDRCCSASFCRSRSPSSPYPLESFITSARTVGRRSARRAGARTGVSATRRRKLRSPAPRVLITLYDIVIVLPLLVERMAKTARAPAVRPAACGSENGRTVVKRRAFLASIPLLGLTPLAACTDPRSHAHAVYLLVDTSGTYAEEVGKAELIVNYLLGSLQPGDSLAVARVRSRSFSEKDIIAKATFDQRPSQANAQKRLFKERVQAFTATARGSVHTDITGGLIQGALFLNETGAGQKTILIFSDMQEELDRATVRNFPIDLKDIRVVAVNVVKLKTDNVDPRRYLGRLDDWQKRVEAAGAREWRVINDLEHLDALLKS
jgi:hypothetical protein